MSDPTSPTTLSLVRRGAFRCAFFGVSFGVAAIVAFWIGGRRQEVPRVEPLAAALLFLLSAIAFAPPVALELVARRWPASRRRDGLVLGLGWLLGTIGLLAGFFQAIFSYTLVRSHSYNEAAIEATREVERMLRRPGELPLIALFMGLSVGPVVALRVRGSSLLRTFGASLGTALLVSPLDYVVFSTTSDDASVVIALNVALAVTVPLAASLGDRVEALVGRLRNTEGPPSSP